MVDVVILFSIFAWIGCLFLVNTATAGIAMAAFALWITLLARIQQADKHHRRLIEALKERPGVPLLKDEPPIDVQNAVADAAKRWRR